MDPRMREDDTGRGMDPRVREDDTGRGMDPRVREDDGKYVVMSAPLRRCCPLVIPAPASSFLPLPRHSCPCLVIPVPPPSFLRRQESIPVFPPTVKPP